MRLSVLFLATAAVAVSQSQPATNTPSLATLLNFEREQTEGSHPAGWSGSPGVHADSKVVHSGKWSALIERDQSSSNEFYTVTQTIPVDFQGSTIEFRGWIKTEDVEKFTALWMRQDSAAGPVEFESMQKLGIKGTNDWKQYSIKFRRSDQARKLIFGFLVGGTGKAWVDDMELLADGKPIWEAPKKLIQETVLDKDKEFLKGSTISLARPLTKPQIANLKMLGLVWGFLKYHDPRVAAGKVHWDFELFRVMPEVLAADSSALAGAAIERWIAKLGDVPECKVCAKLDASSAHLLPAHEQWQTSLPGKLPQMLAAVYANRATGPQFYVDLHQGVGNPNFDDHELDYPFVKFPDAGYQLLSLFRFWNMIEYWFPYRDVIGSDWQGVLEEFVPRLAAAADRTAYQREMIALIARIHDTHANLWNGLQARPPVGNCRAPLTIRFIEDKAVITRTPDSAAGPRRGDVVESIDGVAVEKLAAEWAPYYAASNEPTRLRDIAAALTKGACETDATLRVRHARNEEPQEIKVRRAMMQPAPMTHDLPGAEAFRKLSDDVAYLKLSAVKTKDVDAYIKNAAGTKGMIIDIRNYPAEFMVFALGQRLVEKSTEFARFTVGDLANPGAFHWGKSLSLMPSTKDRYTGKIVILVDEVSVSQAEYTTMAFRSVPGALVVGSTTAGADGNVSTIPLPGGLRSMISGIGVFYPDKRPTQRVGIVPDVEARPTIEGVRDGRDEVLERGLREIVGADAAARIVRTEVARLP